MKYTVNHQIIFTSNLPLIMNPTTLKSASILPAIVVAAASVSASVAAAQPNANSLSPFNWRSAPGSDVETVQKRSHKKKIFSPIVPGELILGKLLKSPAPKEAGVNLEPRTFHVYSKAGM